MNNRYEVTLCLKDCSKLKETFVCKKQANDFMDFFSTDKEVISIYITDKTNSKQEQFIN